MHLEYNNKKLAKVENGDATDLCASGVHLEIVEPLKQKLAFLRAATDERDIRNWKSLRYEQLSGNRKGQCSIRINNKWRLIFKIDGDSNPRKIIVLDVEDYH